MAKRVLRFRPGYTTKDMPLILLDLDLRRFKDRMLKCKYSDRVLDSTTIELTATDENLLDDLVENLTKTGKMAVTKEDTGQRR